MKRNWNNKKNWEYCVGSKWDTHQSQPANDDRRVCNQCPVPTNVSPLAVGSTLECCTNEYVSRFSTGKSEMKQKTKSVWVPAVQRFWHFIIVNWQLAKLFDNEKHDINRTTKRQGKLHELTWVRKRTTSYEINKIINNLGKRMLSNVSHVFHLVNCY